MSVIFRNFKPGLKKGVLILVSFGVFGVIIMPFLSPIAGSIYIFFFTMLVCLSIIEFVFYVIPQMIGQAITGGGIKKSTIKTKKKN